MAFSRRIAVVLPNNTLTIAGTGGGTGSSSGSGVGTGGASIIPKLQMRLTQNVVSKNLTPYAVYAGMGDNDTSVSFFSTSI